MKKNRRNDLAWWLIIRTLRHVATEEWANKFMDRFRIQDPDKSDAKTEHEVWRKHFPYGTTWRTNCGHCAREFTIHVDEANPYPGVYCSKTCSNRHRVARKKFVERPRPCPTPGKASYRDGEAAMKHYTSLKAVNPDLVLNRPYACVCGKYHLGRWKYEEVISG